MDTKQKVLVTGALGFIPSSFIEKLLNNSYIVCGIDNCLTGTYNNIKDFKDHSNFQYVNGNVNIYDNIFKVFDDFTPDYIFHYAACVGVKRTLENPLWVLNDIKGFENILKLAKDFEVKRIFFSSSSEVYGEPVEFPQVEDTTPLNSRLPYAVVKNVGEVYLRAYKKEFDLDYTIFRFFNTFGPRQSDDFVISKFILAALNNDPLTIYGNGNQTRTFCYIEDNVDSTFNSLDNDLAINEVANIGSSDEIPIKDLAIKIIELIDSNSKLEFLPALIEGDMTRRRPDISKMMELLGKDRLTSLDEGLKKTIQYFRDRI